MADEEPWGGVGVPMSGPREIAKFRFEFALVNMLMCYAGGIACILPLGLNNLMKNVNKRFYTRYVRQQAFHKRTGFKVCLDLFRPLTTLLVMQHVLHNNFIYPPRQLNPGRKHDVLAPLGRDMQKNYPRLNGVMDHSHRPLIV